MSHNEYTRDLYSANLVTIFNSINANDQQIDEELMQEFGSAHAAYQDVPEVVNTVPAAFPAGFPPCAVACGLPSRAMSATRTGGACAV
ncbi:hypothetical protein RI054_15g73800 [Pseudoscourfieldia marina]